jgi:hypothetical protein
MCYRGCKPVKSCASCCSSAHNNQEGQKRWQQHADSFIFSSIQVNTVVYAVCFKWMHFSLDCTLVIMKNPNGIFIERRGVPLVKGVGSSRLLRTRRLEDAGSNPGRSDLICSLLYNSLEEALHLQFTGQLSLLPITGLEMSTGASWWRNGKSCDAVGCVFRTFGLEFLPTPSAMKGMSFHTMGLRCPCINLHVTVSGFPDS